MTVGRKTVDGIMKIKSRPEDFVVEEIANLSLQPRKGEYRIYSLKKWGWNTLELISEIARLLKKPASDVDYAGLKDRYALATQYISIKGAAPEKITGKNFEAKLIGFQDRPMGADLIIKNRFEITLRDLTEKECNTILNNLELVQEYGFCNYFDEQRFGSVRHKKGFVTKRLILGHYQGALKLYFTPSKWDSSELKRKKKTILENWGNWSRILRDLENAPISDKRIFEYLLNHPKDFRRATNYLDKRMMALLVSVYQSYIWNETLKEFLSLEGIDTFPVPYLLGEVLFYNRLPLEKLKRFKNLELPVLDSKVQVKDEVLLAATQKVLGAEKIEQKDLDFHRYPRVRFRSTLRKIITFPEELKVNPSEPDETRSVHRVKRDELNKGKLKLLLRFFLPRGSYATMLIKRLALSNNYNFLYRYSTIGSKFYKIDTIF